MTRHATIGHSTSQDSIYAEKQSLAANLITLLAGHVTDDMLINGVPKHKVEASSVKLLDEGFLQ